ncbi:MAG: murein biosynthesis integral membrane protein MurJ [Candidatus Dojkabacteria bacterium]
MSPIRRIISKSKRFILRPQETFAYVAFGMAILIFVGKISGIVKQQVLVGIFGLRSQELDLFLAANTIPEFIFLIVALGGINAALIPVFSQTSANNDAVMLKRVFSSIVNVFFVVMVFLCTLIFIFAPQLVNLVFKLEVGNSGSTLTTEDVDQFVSLLRILIISPVILSVSSIFSSILQIRKQFFVTQFAPIFYNAGLILVAVFVLPRVNYDITYLAYGVLLGSVLHFLIQLPAIFKVRISYSMFIWDIRNIYVLQALKQAAPRTIGLATDYIANIFQTVIALQLVTGSFASFKLALSIREIATLVFGLSVAQALFPRMSELGSEKNITELQDIFSQGLRTILFWTLPVAAMIIVLRTPIVQLVYGLFSDKVDLEETSLLSYCLLFLSLGVVFFASLNIINRVFYSLNDSVTPTVVSVMVITIEIALTYVLANIFSHFSTFSLNPAAFTTVEDYFTKGQGQAAIGGVALAATIAITINVILLSIFLYLRHSIKVWYQPEKILKKVVSASFSLAIGFAVFKFLGDFFRSDRVIGVMLLTLFTSSSMMLVYYLMEKLLKDEDVNILDDPVKRGRKAIKHFLRLVRKSEVSGVST